jgi:hypothetical protein
MSQSKFKATNLLAGTALVALGVAFAGQVSAKDHARVIKSGKDQVSLSISGHVSRQITIVDDGRTSVRHSDSDFSSSRFVMKGAGRINADLKVATKIETAVDDARNSPAIHDAVNGGRTGDDLRTRKAEIQLTHKSFGTVWMGAGDTASNGATESNFSTFTMLPGCTGCVMNGAFRTTSASTGSGPNAVGRLVAGAANGAFGQQDGLGRSTRIRYDTPVIAGFMASTSHLDNQAWDVALRYSGKFAGTKLKAAAAYSNDQTDEQMGASAAFLHSSGIGGGANFEYIQDDTRNDGANGEDPYFYGAHLSFKSKFNEMGSTQIVYMFDSANNKAGSGDIGTTHSVGVAQNIDAAAMSIDVRFTHAHLEADRLLLDNDTVKALSVHTRVKF